MIKKLIIHLKVWTKLIITIICALAIIGFLIFFVYKPTYSVTLNGEFIGYTEDKKKLQDKIYDYSKSGDNNLIAFVDIETLPEYKMCLLKKGITTNSDEIFSKIVSTGIPYYKYYAILDNNEEKFYVQSFEEAENILNELKAKDSNNKDNITYALKYNTELKTFTDTATAVADLYIEKPKIVKKPVSTKVNTSANVDFSNTTLGIALIKPINGTISSRFGVRSSIRSSIHTGLDIAASKGTPIKAAADGTVVYSGRKGSLGNLVVLDHGNGVETYYAHCNSLVATVGEIVEQGEVIAYVGSTGNSTGPHLHLEIRVNGVAKNPQNYLY